MGLTGTPPAVFMREGNVKDPRSKRTRQQLLAAYERQLENGETTPTVSSLAQEAGVSRSSFYKHFAGTEDMGVAALRSILDELGPSGNIEPYAAASREVSAVSFEELFEHLGRHRLLCSAVLFADAQMPALAELHVTLVTHLTVAISAAHTKPDDVDASQAATFLVGGILSLLVEWFQSSAPQSAADLAEIVKRMLPEWLTEEETLEAPILVTHPDEHDE